MVGFEPALSPSPGRDLVGVRVVVVIIFGARVGANGRRVLGTIVVIAIFLDRSGLVVVVVS